MSPEETSRAWWSGTVKGAVKGLLWGLGIGIAASVMLVGLCTAAPALMPVFGAFLSLTPGGLGVAGAAFSIVPMAIFNGVLGLVAGAVNSGNTAVTALHQEKHNQWQQKQDAKIAEIDGREKLLEQKITPSRHVETLVTKGPRTQASFAEAEAERTNAPSTHTIH